MSIKFGLLTNPANNIFEEIKSAKRLGFDYVELGIEVPEGAPEIIFGGKRKISSLLKEFNSPAIAHTAWWIDFGSGYEIVRKGWVEEAKISIDAAKLLDIDKITFHFYSIGLTKEYTPYHKQILANIVRSVREIANYASSKKMTVLFENLPIKKSVVGIKEYKFIIYNVPKLKVHLDVGHAFVENGMKGIRDYIFTFKDKLEHVHVHDNRGENDEHLPLGRGGIDFEQVVKWLKQINYDKTITFEIFTSKEDARNSMIKFEKILSK